MYMYKKKNILYILIVVNVDIYLFNYCLTFTIIQSTKEKKTRENERSRLITSFDALRFGRGRTSCGIVKVGEAVLLVQSEVTALVGVQVVDVQDGFLSRHQQS
jgi:hypothetical protein